VCPYPRVRRRDREREQETRGREREGGKVWWKGARRVGGGGTLHTLSLSLLPPLSLSLSLLSCSTRTCVPGQPFCPREREREGEGRKKRERERRRSLPLPGHPSAPSTNLPSLSFSLLLFPLSRPPPPNPTQPKGHPGRGRLRRPGRPARPARPPGRRGLCVQAPARRRRGPPPLPVKTGMEKTRRRRRPGRLRAPREARACPPPLF
jgi:hypothetical protein